jgi:hypothetical protein
MTERPGCRDGCHKDDFDNNKNLHCKPKVWDFCQMFVINKRKSKTLGMKTIG